MHNNNPKNEMRARERGLHATAIAVCEELLGALRKAKTVDELRDCVATSVDITNILADI